MIVEETQLDGVLLLRPKVHPDSRGFFLESFRADVLAEYGVEDLFVQDNHSRSSARVLRGLHYQLAPFAQGKLVRVSRGAVYDVAVDIRRGSPNFGKWFGHQLDEENLHMLYVPPGFAHGFVVLSDWADFNYKCTAYYSSEHEFGIRWDDPEIGVEWPVEDPLLSARDLENPLLADQLTERLPSFS
ncbi:MAG: dTDP-4-dehydrorhamnose 3,5-epimerase [Pseudomonadota bacterium]